MTLQRLVSKVSKRAQRAIAEARRSVGRPVDGHFTGGRIAAAYIAPAAVFAAVLLLNPEVKASTFFPGATIFSGVLLALCTLSFNRVKDLASEGSAGVWQGSDPMHAAYRFARNSLSAAYVSVFTTGLLIAQMFMGPGLPMRLALALTIALVAHLGVRIWFLLGAIRSQVEATAGQRSAERPRLRNIS